ncbi:hypothetical protein [Bradyrhizobium sp. Tv2a-2]|uniref:hypothetical protein n=1 Tax=Bradyrhizobium sp. Tv2a-2 TaxID=113395 RepID=UPI000465E3F2|nr:hypothetical protein [Bradyrhizobium sp. Tv2a-2]
MPLVSTEATGQYWEPLANGPVAQCELVSQAPGLLGATLPTTGTIAASGNWISAIIVSDGFKSLSVGAKSTQTGAINVQRYIDRAGTVPVGTVVTAALVAGTAQWVTSNDGMAFQSFTVQITNTGASAATVTNFAVLLNAN